MRLVDEISDVLRMRGITPPGVIDVCGTFGDLLWPPSGEIEEVQKRHREDPAFTVTGYTRWIALARIGSEIRFYAAPIPEGGPEDRARVDAIKAEEDARELAIFEDVADAVTFTIEYLGGASLGTIRVVRRKPSWA